MHLHIPIEIDPPEFRKWRKIINPITVAGRGRPDRGRWSSTTSTWFIDQIIEAGEADLAEVIGVPSIVHRRLARASTSTTGSATPRAHHARAGRSARQPGATSRPSRSTSPTLERADAGGHRRPRGPHPQDDIISYLVQQEVDGRPVTDDEVFSMVELLLSGGVGTTASLVSQTAGLALPAPGRPPGSSSTTRRCSTGRSRSSSAYFSPTQALARTVIQDTEFHGCPMKKGDRVLLAWSSANRDADQFENPDEVEHRPLAEPAHRLRHRRAPLRRLPPRPGDGQGAAQPDPARGCPTTSSTSTASSPTRTRASTTAGSASRRPSPPARAGCRRAPSEASPPASARTDRDASLSTDASRSSPARPAGRAAPTRSASRPTAPTSSPSTSAPTSPRSAIRWPPRTTSPRPPAWSRRRAGVVARQVDVRDRGALQAAVDEGVATLGPVWIVVANARIAR